MKKRILIILLLSFILLSACSGNGNNTNVSTDDAVSAITEPEITDPAPDSDPDSNTDPAPTSTPEAVAADDGGGDRFSMLVSGGVGNGIEGESILHAFCWSFSTIIENMPDIAAAGFTAVQTSPVSECITADFNGAQGMDIGGPNGFWYYHYQPVSYQIGNYQLGTEEEFAEMCKVAEEHGVKVIVDAVVNHFSSNFDKISDDVKNIPGGAFHEPAPISVWSSRLHMTQNQLLGLWDVNTQNPAVQQEVLKYLQRCVELGASGFRYDAAAHIELPEDDLSFASDFWPVVLDNGAQFQYGEILDANQAGLYTGYMHVTDANFGTALARSVRSGRLSYRLQNNYSVEATPDRLVLWVESHDTYCNEGETADLTPKQILYGWAVVAARADSTGLYFSRPDGSSPGVDNRWGNNTVGERGNDEFKSPEVTALNHFKKAMQGEDEYFSNPLRTDSFLMIERGDSGAVLINMAENIKLDGVNVQSLKDGNYTCTITNRAFTVSEGKLSGDVDAESVMVLIYD